MTYDKSNIVFQPIPQDSRFLNLTNQTFGRLRVLGFAGKLPVYRKLWWCECQCGKIKKIDTSSLQRKLTLSCGCIQKEAARKANGTHLLAKHPLYKIWIQMIKRCFNTQHRQYPDYGGRGITVCERWQDITNFIKDMDNRPSNKYTLERKNNDGNYCPANVIWGTWSQQANNKRTTHFITYQGRTQSLTLWTTELNISRTMVFARLRRGWDVIQALTVPPQ